MSRRRISEAETRKELIDPQLEKVGWFLRDKTKVGTEIPVAGYDAEPWNGIMSYCLYRKNGDVLITDTSKTHAAMRLIDVFKRFNQARRTLFVANNTREGLNGLRTISR